MADLVTAEQVATWDTNYEMGEVWQEADATNRLKAVNTAEGVWRGYFWAVSPFDNSDVAAKLHFPLALHARAIVEAQGEVTDVLPDIVTDILEPYFRKKITPLKLTGRASNTPTPGNLVLKGRESAGANIKAAVITTGSPGTSEADSGLSVTITPSSTSKKILLTCVGGMFSHENNFGNNTWNFKLLRGSTGLTNFRFAEGYSSSHSLAVSTIDSPNTTNAVTYKLRWVVNTLTNIGSNGATSNQPMTLTATEVD